jgi:AAA family ATP:ADP antiporter
MTASDRPDRNAWLDRTLRLFADVRAGEGPTALLLALNIFLILMAYYLLKPVREALILGEGSAELKTYSSAGQVALLAVIVPVYGRLVVRLPRRRLINVVTFFFIACIVVFFALTQAGAQVGVPYFLWIGIFNMLIVAQFWSFANDIYSKEEGERLFPIVGFGASAGAVLGSMVAARLIPLVGVYQLLLVGAVLLGVELQITNYVDRRARRPSEAPKGAKAGPAGSRSNAFSLVLRTPYLLLIALMLVLLNTVNTTGEYILGSIVKEAAVKYVAEGRSGGMGVEDLIARFYSRYFGLVNLSGLLLQLFVVSRVVRHLGVSIAVAILPLLSFGAYNVLAFMPNLWWVLGAKVAENSTDYSLNNTVRNMLFLPCSREEKYSAKQAIDSFFVRMGDVVSALLVFLGTTAGLGAAGFAKVNVLVAAAWLALAVVVGRRYLRRQPPEAS